MADEQTDWDQLNDKQRQFVLNRLKKMDRIDAYMDAYDVKNRTDARRNSFRLATTNDNVKRILDQEFAECVRGAKGDFALALEEAAAQILEIMRMGNSEYNTRLKAAMYVFRAAGAEEPVKKAVELSGEVKQVIELKDVILESGLDRGSSEQTERGNDGDQS